MNIQREHHVLNYTNVLTSVEIPQTKNSWAYFVFYMNLKRTSREYHKNLKESAVTGAAFWRSSFCAYY